jgi:hypothetical protein
MNPMLAHAMRNEELAFSLFCAPEWSTSFSLYARSEISVAAHKPTPLLLAKLLIFIACICKEYNAARKQCKKRNDLKSNHGVEFGKNRQTRLFFIDLDCVSYVVVRIIHKQSTFAVA